MERQPDGAHLDLTGAEAYRQMLEEAGLTLDRELDNDNNPTSTSR